MDYSKPLPNQRHEKFVLGLLEGKTDGQAYEDAGYKPDRGNASTLTTKHNIQARLAFLQSEAAESAGIDAAWVTKRLVENVERAMQVAEVRGPDGERTGVYTYQGAVANKALELLGRNIGMFKDAAPVNVNVNLPGDESDFADRLRAQRKLRSDGKTQLH
ncbi:MAG: hypothetical protein IH905_13155 [Proteobacteria bacterium]|nr:hypothetical protein [Pseudomonadota bacterium]